MLRSWVEIERVVGLCGGLLGLGLRGSTWRFMGRVISRVTILITLLRGLIPPLITTHEPPSRISRCLGLRVWLRGTIGFTGGCRL